MAFVTAEFQELLSSKKAGPSTDLFATPSQLKSGGKMRFSTLGSTSLHYFECWTTTSEGRPFCVRFKSKPTAVEMQQLATDQGLTLQDQFGNASYPKLTMAFWIWNYETSSVQLLQINQSTILDAIGGLFSDEDVAADPGKWDLQLSRQGEGKTQTKYTITLLPGFRTKPDVGAQVSAAWAECEAKGYNLEAVLTGGDPTKPGV